MEKELTLGGYKHIRPFPVTSLNSNVARRDFYHRAITSTSKNQEHLIFLLEKAKL